MLLVDGKEYCQFESFNATCPINEVILIDEARYGRLQLGRCVYCCAELSSSSSRRKLELNLLA